MAAITLPKTGDQTLDLFFSRLKSELDPLLANRLMQGNVLKDLALIQGNNQINHLLQRQPLGWIVIDQSAVSQFYRVSWDMNFLVLNASQPATISLWVF